MNLNTFGGRLKQERDRLGLSQADCAARGGVQRRAQINYEQNERLPDAGYLLGLAFAGADIQYIVTGVRSDSALSPDERVLLERYRASPAALRDAALRVLLGGNPSQPAVTQMAYGGVGQQVAGNVAVVHQPVAGYGEQGTAKRETKGGRKRGVDSGG